MVSTGFFRQIAKKRPKKDRKTTQKEKSVQICPSFPPTFLMIHLKNKCNFATRKTKSHTHESVYTCFYQPFHSGFGVIPRTGPRKKGDDF